MSSYEPNSQYVVFGDSWSDNGNLQSLIEEAFGFPVINPQIYTEGRQTNKYNYADYMQDFMSVSDENFENFAVAGAQGIPDRPLSSIVTQLDPDTHPGNYKFDLSAQVDRYIAQLDETDSPADTTASIVIGGNDMLAGTLAFLNEPGIDLEARSIQHGNELFDAVYAQVEKLAAAGVGEVHLHTLPDLNIFPQTSPETNPATLYAVEAFNSRLDEASFKALGIDVKVLDAGAMLEEIAADYTTFGLRTFEDPISLDTRTFNPAVEGVPQDQIALTDLIHRSDSLDQKMARFQFESLTSDVEIGTDEHEVIRGGRDDDLVLGRGGDDRILLRQGDDIGFGGLGDDFISGGKGNDLIAGGSGNDFIKGGRGDDFLADNHGNDIVRAGSGDDVIVDGAGSDVAFGGSGDDVFIFNDQVLYGGDSSGDVNTFVGGRGHDTLYLRLTQEDVDNFNDGTLTLQDLGINTIGVEEVVATAGLDIPDEIADVALVQEADYWGLI